MPGESQSDPPTGAASEAATASEATARTAGVDVAEAAAEAAAVGHAEAAPAPADALATEATATPGAADASEADAAVADDATSAVDSVVAAHPTFPPDAPLLLEVEQPQPGSLIRADESLLGFGWALANSRVLSIAVDLDGQHVCNASTGLARTDIAELYNDHPGSARAGFTFVARLPPHPGGAAELRLTVRTETGEHVHPVPIEVVARQAPVAAPARDPASEVAALGLPELPPVIAPPSPDLVPIHAELEEARLDAAGLLHVRGWTVSVRDTASVEVFFEDCSLGFADTALSRGDVAVAHPAYPNAASAGFALTAAVPDDLAASAASGQTVTVVVTDASGRTETVGRTVSGGHGSAGDPAAARALLPPMQVSLEESRINEVGTLRVRGWVLSLTPIEHVRVYLGEQQIGTAAHNLPREDVALAHPDYPNSAHAGFLMQLDLEDESLAGRVVRIVVSGLGGIRRELSATVAVAPVVRRRDRVAAAVHFHCDAISLSEDGTLYLKGWAVCPTGTQAIEIALGEEAIGEAQLGGERADVGNAYPLVPGSRNAGFHFLGRSAARQEGEQVVRITLRGRGGEERVVLQPVLARPEETVPQDVEAAQAADAGIRFFLDSPAVKDGKAVEPARGFLSINGWAFSSAGISSIEVFVDGRSQGQAYRGIRREDLHTYFGRKEALRSGFAMLVPPQVLKQGHHDMRVVIRDHAGHVEEVAYTIDAEPSMQGAGPWTLRHKITDAEADLQRALLKAAGFDPEWTLLLLPGGAGGAAAKRLRATLESLRTQAYPDWRAVIPTGSEADREALLAALLPEFADIAERLSVVAAGADAPLAGFAPRGARPALFGLLAAGDLLGEDALLELSIEAAGAAAGHQRADFLYSDERRVDPADGTVRAFFKPDWSPDLLLSTNYVGRLWAATPDLIERAGIVLGDVDRHGEYDLVLRLTERARRVAHVAKVLCARGARALDTPAAERRALQRALLRRGIQAEIQPGFLPGTFRVKRALAGEPLVSIIIPTIAARGLVKVAIESIREKTRYRNFEIVCLDNIREGQSADGFDWKAWLRDNADSVIEIDEKFNWSRFNNIAVRQSRGDVLLFLNDDVEVTDGTWLEGLLEQAQRADVGAVGPQLLYPDGNVQHAGMFLSRNVGRHAFRFSPREEPGPFGLARTQRNVIAVTGACLMVRRDVFEALGGFDEEHSIINNDLDFCLRARASGRFVVYTPHVTLTHHEMVSRGEHRDAYNKARFDAAWRDLFLAGDPYFNPNLSSDYDDYVPDEEPVRVVPVGHPVIAKERVRRILVVKVDHIGDFISAFPAFRRLKQQFQNAELTVLAAPGSVALAPLEPAIDRVLAFEFFHARSERGRRTVSKRDLQRLQDELAPYRFDLALDLRRQPDTRPLLQHTGARWLAGFDVHNSTTWLDIAVEWEGDVARAHKRTHISDALTQFVDAVAVACESDRLNIHSDLRAAQGREGLAALPEMAALAPALLARPLVVVHTGAGSENKQWPLASFAGLIDLLVARHGVNVAIIGGPDEGPAVDQVIGETREPERVFRLVGTLGLKQLPLLLLACDLYVGNDSGPKHMAASLGVPTIGVHSGSVDATEWGPMGPAAVGIRRDMTCSPCYLAKVSDCHRGLACLHGIRVGDVYRACRRLLALSRRPAGAVDAGLLAAGQ